MSVRKPLDPNCNGGIWCEVEGHLQETRHSNGRVKFAHTPLTPGQRRTLMERLAAAAIEGETKP